MKRVALIVGINRYPFIKNDKGECLNLTTPARDASAIAYRLERDGNFEVMRYPSKDPWEIDPKPQQPVNAEALKNEITRLFQPKGNVPDTALLFFSGSGFRLNNQEGTTEGFLGTSDVNPRKNIWGVSLKWLHTVLQNSPIQQQIIWLDCSYSGEFLPSTKSTEITDPNKKRAQCFIVATQDDQLSYAVNQQGLLTQWILKNSDPANQANGIVTTKTLAESFPSQFKIDDITQNPICFNSGDPIILTSIGDIHFHQQSEH
ncbi:MAG: caspase family protein, partial [Planktothrix sp.]